MIIHQSVYATSLTNYVINQRTFDKRCSTSVVIVPGDKVTEVLHHLFVEL